MTCPADPLLRGRMAGSLPDPSAIVHAELHGPDRSSGPPHAMDTNDQQTLACTPPDLPTARACIVVIHGDGFGQRVELGSDPVVIGRATGADLRIPNPGVSRHHCEIRRVGDAWVLRDLGSTNGTRIGEAKIAEAALADGDQITIGQSILKFVADANVEALYHERVARLLFRDQLTGLLGRQEFIDAAEQRISGSLESAAPLSLALIDVEVDGAGTDDEEAGTDAVLAHAATLISGELTDADLAARIGERRFAVVLAGRGMEAAEALVARLQRRIAVPDAATGRAHVRVRVRGGAAQLQPGSASLGHLVKRIRDTVSG